MASQQRGRSPSGGPRGQVMGAAASAYPFQGPAAGPGLGQTRRYRSYDVQHAPYDANVSIGVAARHSSGPIPYAISTTLTSLSASMQQQYMQAANATQHPGFREQQMSPSSPHGHISPTHGSISPGTRNPLEMSFPVNEVDQRGAFQSAPSDYNFPPAASGLPDVSQQQHALNSFLVESALQADGQVTAQSVNPTDLLGQAASPFQAAVASSKAPEMERDTSSHSYTNASLEQYGYPSAQQSPGDSLAPASAAFPQGQPLQDWTAMLRSASHQGTAFQGHRRTPSEHSDVSSAPSPFLANTDSFDPADQQRSPLLQSQPDATYQDALGIEQFTISEDVHNHGLSPGPSPGVSPRLNPHVDLNLGQDAAFVLPPSVAHNQFQALGPPEVYPAIKSERVPSLQLNNGSGELGSNGAMAPPEINIEYAAPSKQPTLEPPQTAGDGNALSLPERGGERRCSAWCGFGPCSDWANPPSQAGRDAFVPFPIPTSAAHRCRGPPRPTRRRPSIRGGRCRPTLRWPAAARPARPSQVDGRRRRRSRIGTTCSGWRIRADRGPERQTRSGFRSIRRRSSAPGVRSGSPGPTTCDRTCVPTRTSGRLCARSAARPLRASTTASATRVCTRARRSLCAVASSSRASRGAADVGSPAPTPSVVISAARPAARASSLCWTRKRRSGSGSNSSNSGSSNDGKNNNNNNNKNNTLRTATSTSRVISSRSPIRPVYRCTTKQRPISCAAAAVAATA